MDRLGLRNAIASWIQDFPSMHTHTEMSEQFKDLGLPDPGIDGSKNERAVRCVEMLDQADIAGIASRILSSRSLPASVRNSIQEPLWDGAQDVPNIPKRTRHEIASDVDIAELFLSWNDFLSLLDRLFVLDDRYSLAIFGEMFGSDNDSSLRGQIRRHVGRNLGDWSTWDLFERLGAFDCTDRRFVLLIEGLASSDNLPNETRQRQFVELINARLSRIGARLEEVERLDGYPRFLVTSVGGAQNRSPKNIIFASTVKPDLRFSNAIDNDVEIVTHADKVLVFDRQIGEQGLNWATLQDWWAEKNKIDSPDEAKRTLYRRLRSALPDSSPPQKNFYDSYYETFGEMVPRLPALLPEVWFCWDPQTMRQRGRDALLRLRMDFILLLPGRRRIVIEIDGMSHYAGEGGLADSYRYAETMASDRELKMSGYDVYRFGAQDVISQEKALHSTGVFFRALYQRYGLTD